MQYLYMVYDDQNVIFSISHEIRPWFVDWCDISTHIFQGYSTVIGIIECASVNEPILKDSGPSN